MSRDASTALGAIPPHPLHRSGRVRRAALPLLAVVGPVVLAFAAGGKVMDHARFRESLAGFDAFPHSVRGGAAWAAPAVEVLPLLLLLSGRVRAAAAASLSLLAMFTAALSWQRAVGKPPTCACVGLWARYLSVREDFAGSLVRNGLLAATSVLTLLLARPRHDQDESLAAPAQRPGGADPG